MTAILEKVYLIAVPESSSTLKSILRTIACLCQNNFQFVDLAVFLLLPTNFPITPVFPW